VRPIDELVDPAAAGGAFGFDAAGGDIRLYDAQGTLRELGLSPLDRSFADAVGLRQAIIASIEADGLTGWLIVATPPADERLYMARAIAVQLAAALDRATAAEAWRSAAAAEERVRLARDLHDGILQTLTGLSLQLRVIQQEATAAPDAAAERIARLETALRSEQQELRAFIEGLRPRGAPPADGSARLATLAQLLSHQWDIAVDTAELQEPPPSIAADVRQIVREATANAVRHGQARSIRLAGAADGAGYRLTIRDDGAGFGRNGRFDAETLRREGFGPRSLLARIDRLGGSIEIESGAAGARLDIRFPTAREVTA
jgi:signal transduction histidine kinase